MKVFIQNLFAEIKEQMKKMFLEQFTQQEERINIFESVKSMLQQYTISFKSAMCTSESKIKVIEQYGRSMYLRLESVPAAENETSEDIFNNVLDKKGNERKYQYI